jgi:hypothetical protein
VTAPDATGELRATVEIDYGQWYLFDPDADRDWLGDLVATDPVAQAQLEERRCASSGSAAIIYALKHDGPTGIVVRSVAPAPVLDEAADHLAECSLHLPGGRLAVSGWETTVIGGVIAIPAEPLRARIAWFGLARSAETGDEAAESFMVTLFPGPTGPVDVLRCWPAWAPPVAESTTTSGLRRFAGTRAAEARQSMEPLPLGFWPPYPQTTDGYVTSLWRDPADGSRWADGRGEGDHEVLRELTPDEADVLEGQGFPQVHTYAMDADGRIWTSGQMPIERTPCLNLIQRTHFQTVRGLLGDEALRMIELPPGWNRLYRLARDGRGGHVPVDAIDDADDAYYQRWPDDGPGPPGPPS